MGKPDLIARLKELGEKLGRELNIDGNAAELEQRIKEAETELALLEGDGENNDGNGSGNENGEGTEGGEGNNDGGSFGGEIIQPKEGTVIEGQITLNAPLSNVSRRRVKLSETLDIWHYKKNVDRQNPNKVVRVREIVPKGEDILVDSDEAADIIANGHGRAL